jgi:aminopeptidase N
MLYNLHFRTRTFAVLFHIVPIFLSAQLLTNKLEYTKYDSLLGTVSPLRNYDVRHYDLSVDFDLEKKTIKGSVKMDFIPVEAMQTLQLDLFEAYDISDIRINGKKVKYTRDNNFVFAKLPNMLEKGKRYAITTTYSGKPIQAKKAPWDGGFDWKKDGNDNHWVGVACEGLGASSWWPCKDHWSDEPEEGVTATYSVPKPYEVVGNGKLIYKVDSCKKMHYTWDVKNPINLYNVTFNIGQYAHWDTMFQSTESKKELQLSYWVLKENEAKARRQFEQVIPMMECFESKFGPYPFYEDGYKLVETPYLGMEHQSCVAYGNKYKAGYLGDLKMTGGYDFDYIIIHETGHEWFGNNITAADNADMWIHEGFTTYSESMYAECMYGKSAGARYLDKMRSRVRNDRPMVGNYGVAKEGSGDMYAKGALFIHTLRVQLQDDELWYRILKEINKEFRHKTTNYEDVLGFFNRQTKRNWSNIFDIYLKEKDIPKLTITQDKSLKKSTLVLKSPNTAKKLELRVDYELDGVEKSQILTSDNAVDIQYKESFKVIENSYIKYEKK